MRGVDGAVIDEALDERRLGSADNRLDLPDGETDGDGGRSDPDELAAHRLLERRRRDLDRVADPRKRRARAYALLARNGFGPEIASRLSASVVDRDAGSEVG